jgi:hypothetical protein
MIPRDGQAAGTVDILDELAERDALGVCSCCACERQVRELVKKAAAEIRDLRAKLTQKQAVMQAISEATVGLPISDFMLSFPLVRAVVDALTRDRALAAGRMNYSLSAQEQAAAIIEQEHGMFLPIGSTESLEHAITAAIEAARTAPK